MKVSGSHTRTAGAGKREINYTVFGSTVNAVGDKLHRMDLVIVFASGLSRPTITWGVQGEVSIWLSSFRSSVFPCSSLIITFNPS